jgi:energy-coupling factor transport system permease protein
MNLTFYNDKATWLHQLDPRTKIAAVLLIFIICLCFNHPLFMAMILASVLFVFVTAKSMNVLWKLRFLLMLLFIFSVVLWPFFIKGKTILFRWHALEVSSESLLYGFAMGLRLITFVSAGLLLLATTKNEEITNGLIRLGIPYPIAFALATAIRLAPTFADAGTTIVQAQVSRGLDLDSKNIFSRFKRFAPLAIPIFISAMRYTNLLAMALESKGFRPDAPRTSYYEPQITGRDWLVLGSLILALAACLYMRLSLQWGIIIPGRM